jgi:hypothetical protein
MATLSAWPMQPGDQDPMAQGHRLCLATQGQGRAADRGRKRAGGGRGLTGEGRFTSARSRRVGGVAERGGSERGGVFPGSGNPSVSTFPGSRAWCGGFRRAWREGGDGLGLGDERENREEQGRGGGVVGEGLATCSSPGGAHGRRRDGSEQQPRAAPWALS